MSDAKRFAIDMQHCVANNMPLNATYRSLLFEGIDKQHIQSLYAYENLSIKPCEDKLLYIGELSQSVLKSMPKEIMKAVKKNSLHNSICDIYYQVKQDNKSIAEKLAAEEEIMQQIFEMVSNEKDNEIYRNVTQEEIEKIAKCQNTFKRIGLDTILNISECFVSLEMNCEEINLNREQLLYIIKATLETFTAFCICPIYNELNEEDENVYGVRIFWGIELREG